ncbi:MAG: hypothetical protein ACI4TE_08890 [Alphaproteobacteria bacterium]
MKKIYAPTALIFLFTALSTAEAAVSASQICSIYFDTMSECTSARAADTSGSTLSACTYTAGSGYQWCVESTGGECAYNTASECTAVAGHGTCTRASTGCYYPTSCSSGYYQNTELTITFNGTGVAVPTCAECPENGTCNGTSITCNSGYTLTSTNPGSGLALRGTKWCVTSSGGTNNGTSDNTVSDTISGSCPSGLSKSADGCCCVK